jgi:mannose-6-phosphate isomerase-like protein (cupin superfamily)
MLPELSPFWKCLNERYSSLSFREQFVTIVSRAMLTEQRAMERTPSQIKVVGPDEGEALWALGEKVTFKLTPEDTDGRFGISEVVAQPGNGFPPHIHRREDEMFYILDGDFTLVQGERTLTCSRGSAAYLPKNFMHTYNNRGTTPGRIVVAVTPCGFERFIREWSHPVEDPAEPPPPPTREDIDKLMAAAPQYGVELYPQVEAVPDTRTPAAAEQAYWVLGQLVNFRLISEQTAGNFSLVELSSFPGEGVPSHLHTDREEVFYVLDGTIEFSFESGLERLGPGNLVFVPRGALHGFRNVGSETARLLDLHSPGGFESFFVEVGEPATSSTRPAAEPHNLERLLPILQKHGMQIPLPSA